MELAKPIDNEIKTGAHVDIYKRALTIFAERHGFEIDVQDCDTKQDVFRFAEEMVWTPVEVREYLTLLSEVRDEMLSQELEVRQREALHPTRVMLGRVASRVIDFFEGGPNASSL